MPSAELPQFALTLAQDARSEEAGRLWGAVEAAAAFIPGGPWPRDADALEGQLLAIADAPFERGRDDGRALSLEDVATWICNLD